MFLYIALAYKWLLCLYLTTHIMWLLNQKRSDRTNDTAPIAAPELSIRAAEMNKSKEAVILAN